MNWFTGVVEDRFDPDTLGRVRVRIFGLHTDDLAKIPTTDLPWAHVVMPPTSASISGVGLSPTGLVEGSWVVGFFADGENCQDPIVLGSIHGYPTQANADRRAFKDSDNKYPRWLNDTDVSKIARETWKSHEAYAARTAAVVSNVETATPPELKTIEKSNPASYYERKKWSEPTPRDGLEGMYPYVHVWESETGIIREHDDTPGGSRIHEYHPSGTFYEVYPNGKKVTKVVGDNYTILMHDDNILIRGSQNITIEGDCKQLIHGDLTVEVTGDYNLKVHGNRSTKVMMNDSMEVIGNQSINIAESSLFRVGVNQTILVDADKTETIGGKSTLTVTGAVSQVFFDTLSVFSSSDQTISTGASQTLTSSSGLNFNSQAAWTLKCNADMTINVSGGFTTTTGGALSVTSGGALTYTAPSIDFK